MNTEDNLKSKTLYKIWLCLLKVMPIITALAYLIHTIFSYFGITVLLLSSLAKMSLIPLIFMYVSSYVFRFCAYHKMFLHYIAINDIVKICSYYAEINIYSNKMFIIHMIIAGTSLFLGLYLYVRNHKETVA